MKSNYHFEQIESMRVLHLYGEPISRAETYGRLIKDGKIEGGLIHFFCDAIDTALAELPAPVRLAISKGYTLWADRMLRRGPGNSYAELRALAESSGLGWSSFSRALCAPDLGTFLAGIAQSADAEHLPQFGCTSLFKINTDGSAVFGRNLDYSGVGVWDRRPLITINHATEGSNHHSTVSLGTDGVSYASISGFNSSGMVLMLHQAYTKTSFGLSAPLYSIGEMCLRSSGTLASAIDFLNNHRPLSTWFFVLVSLREKQAAVVESSRGHFFVRPFDPKDGFLAQTNHMHQPGREKREVMTLPGRFNSVFRMKKAREFGAKSNLSIENIRELLSHQKRSDGHIETAIDVMKSQTIQTCLFDMSASGEIRLGISIDPAPAATGRMAWIGIDELLAKKTDPTKSGFEVSKSVASAARENQLHHSALYTKIMKGEGTRSFESLIGEQTKSVTSQLLYAYLLWKEKQYEKCREVCEIAKLAKDSTLKEAPQLKSSFELLEYFSLANLGELETALDLASKCFQSGIENPILRRLTTEFLERKKVPPASRKLAFNFFNGDLDMGQF